MSQALPADARDDRTIDERLRELEAIEDELRLVATTDCAYADYCRAWLDSLEEARSDA
ncbi:hypothetical protein [Halalkalicoccus sp. NIPERK01]|uniref:hypothetical protein n=1 Tax=Halalkalicoccus sp. NIPERK01 TaxID=3053469 RepID=UPI00256F28B9|nr:hypothetical protein [Halalkalicoccus sp. NIPERK01]MDL5361312.1 hypothetical protein [Halalkalicoccus sp. NIPERK01]